MAFSKYSVIVEKFETLIEALETHMRTRDFYDIFQLMSDDIDGEKWVLENPDYTVIQKIHGIYEE